MLCALFWVAILAACEDSGPGTWEATIRPPDGLSLGAAVVEIQGRGLNGFADAGSTEVFGGEMFDPIQNSRLVLVGRSNGPLTFRINVLDVAHGPPSVAVVQAVDGSDVGVSLVGIVVSLRRR